MVIVFYSFYIFFDNLRFVPVHKGVEVVWVLVFNFLFLLFLFFQYVYYLFFGFIKVILVSK